MEEVKVCACCKLPKQLVEYYLQKSGKFGVTSVCIECTKIKDSTRISKPKVQNILRVKVEKAGFEFKALKFDWSSLKWENLITINSNMALIASEKIKLEHNRE